MDSDGETDIDSATDEYPEPQGRWSAEAANYQTFQSKQSLGEGPSSGYSLINRASGVRSEEDGGTFESEGAPNSLSTLLNDGVFKRATLSVLSGDRNGVGADVTRATSVSQEKWITDISTTVNTAAKSFVAGGSYNVPEVGGIMITANSKGDVNATLFLGTDAFGVWFSSTRPREGFTSWVEYVPEIGGYADSAMIGFDLVHRSVDVGFIVPGPTWFGWHPIGELSTRFDFSGSNNGLP